MSDHLVLYHYWRSSCSWRVRWALEIKGIPYKAVAVNLLKDEQQSAIYREKNPAGLVPSIVVGDKTFGESMAIVEWIDETWSQNPLLPKAPVDRLRVRQLYMTISSGTQPLQNLGPQRYYSPERDAQQAYARHWINKGLTTYETILATTGNPGTFSFGSEITMADLCLIPQCYNGLRFGVVLDDYPRIKKIYEACLATEACQRARPENQEDAVLQ